MSFDPFHVFYLPIIATSSELQTWDNTDESKEQFFKFVNVNFDKRAFVILEQVNSPFIGDFISNAHASESNNVKAFAKKLRDYMKKKDWKHFIIIS